jgi:hypothetical protein
MVEETKNTEDKKKLGIIGKLKSIYRSQIPVKLKQLHTGTFFGAFAVHAVLIIVFFYMIFSTLTNCTTTNYISLKYINNDYTDCEQVPITVSDIFFLTDTGTWSSKSDFIYSDSLIKSSFKAYENSDQGFEDDMSTFDEEFTSFSTDLKNYQYSENMLRMIGFRNGSASSTLTSEILLDYQYILEPEVSDVYFISDDCSIFNSEQDFASISSKEAESTRYTSTTSMSIDDQELTIQLVLGYTGDDDNFRFDEEINCPNGFWGQLQSSTSLLCLMSLDVNVVMTVASLNEGMSDPDEELLPVQGADYAYLSRKFESGTTIVKYTDGTYYIKSRTNSLVSVSFEHWSGDICSNCSTSSSEDCYSNDFDISIQPQNLFYSSSKDDGTNNITDIFSIPNYDETNECGLYSQLIAYPASANTLDTCDVIDTSCIASYIGDGWCDLENNNNCCDYDGGDCCPDTCIDDIYECGVAGYRCCETDADCSAACDASVTDCSTWSTGDTFFFDDDFTSSRRLDTLPTANRANKASVDVSLNKDSLVGEYHSNKKPLQQAVNPYEKYLAEQKRKELRDLQAIETMSMHEEASSKLKDARSKQSLVEELESAKAFHLKLKNAYVSKSERNARKKAIQSGHDDSDESIELYLEEKGKAISRKKANKMIQDRLLASKKQQYANKKTKHTALSDLLGDKSFSSLSEDSKIEITSIYNDIQKEEFEEGQKKHAMRKFNSIMHVARKMVVSGEYQSASRITREHKIRHDSTHKRGFQNQLNKRGRDYETLHKMLHIPDHTEQQGQSLWESEDHFIASIEEQHRHLTISQSDFGNTTVAGITLDSSNMRLIAQADNPNMGNVSGYLEFRVNTTLCGFQSTITTSCDDYSNPLNPCNFDPTRATSCTSAPPTEQWLPVCTEGMEETEMDAICGGYCQTIHGTNFTGFGVNNADLTGFLSGNTSNINVVYSELYHYYINSGGVKLYFSSDALDAIDDIYDTTDRLDMLEFDAMTILPPDGANEGPACDNLACFCHYIWPREQMQWSFRIQSDTRYLNSLFYQLPSRKTQCFNPFEIDDITYTPTDFVESFYDCTTESCPSFFEALGIAFANASSFHDIILAVVVAGLVWYLKSFKNEVVEFKDADEVEMVLYDLAVQEMDRRSEVAEDFEDLSTNPPKSDEEEVTQQEQTLELTSFDNEATI